MNSWALVFVLIQSLSAASDSRAIMQQVQDRARSASQRYEGTLQVLRASNKISEKRWIYERIGSAGASKAVLRFTAPAEVKGVALLVWNHPERASDQWMWTPALGRERRIALQDRSTRFFGTDFSFEDLEERDVNQYEYRVLGEESIDGANCWKLESRPRKSKVSQYTHSYLWVIQDRYVIALIEAYRGERLARKIRYAKHQKVQNIWTPLLIEVEDLSRKTKTILKLDKLEYNVTIKEEAFTLEALRRGS